MGKILFTAKKRNVIAAIKYGLLYNWYAATDSRKITSSDTWKISYGTSFGTSAYYILRTYLGGATKGYKLKETGFTYWDSPNTGATNEVGFNLRAGGSRNADGTFGGLKTTAELGDLNTGSSAPYGSNWEAYYSSANFNFPPTNSANLGHAYRFYRPATASEQLLADGTACDSYVGNDGKIYRTVKIGTQVWIADNIAETKFRNGDTIPFAGGNGINFTNAEWAALTTAGCCPYNNDWTNVLL